MADEELIADIAVRYPSGAGVEACLRIPLAPAVTVLFGPSGSGKTTILRCLAGLERPLSGIIRFGRETWFDGARGIWVPPQRRRIGYVFQDDALFPHLTVRANIGYGLRGLSRAEREERTAGMLRLLGLEGLAERLPQTLSGGQRRRVALARALAPGPRLILLDEPLSALDAPARAAIQRDLRRLVLDRGTPAILVTHDRSEALTLGDRMAVVMNGLIRQTGDVAEVFSRPADLDVAGVVGVETVVPGRIVERSAGLATVAAGGARLLALDPGGDADDVFVSIRAEDVVLAKGQLGDLSAQNRLGGRITSVQPEGPVYRVTIDCGFPLAAVVTRPTIEHLGLKEGEQVTAAVKAPSVHLIPHGRGRPDATALWNGAEV